MSDDYKIVWNSKKIIDEINAKKEIAAKKIAAQIKKSAQELCPVGEWERNVAAKGRYKGKSWTARKPGTLKKSIRYKKSKYKDGGCIVTAGGLDAFYASFVELGVEIKNLKRKKPFLRPALDKNKQIYKKEIEKIIKSL